MSQSYEQLVNGVTTFADLYDKINGSTEACRSDFSGTAFPSSPTTGQTCYRTDLDATYRYKGAITGWAVDDPTLVTDEVETARGSTATLDARLSVAINEDGTLKGDAPSSDWWTVEADDVEYVSATEFTVEGDKTAIYLENRAVYLTQTTSGVAWVSEANAAGSPLVTTVVVKGGVSVDSGLSAVKYGQPDGNQPFNELTDFSDLTEETTPASGDLLVLEKAAGGKRKVDVDNIGGGGGKVVGEVYIYAGTTAPDDSLECTGATLDSVASTEYADLFTAIGTTWGGTGADDFDIPDMYTDGLFIRSRTATTTIGTVQSDAYLNHSHTGSTGTESAHTHGVTPAKGTSSNASNTNNPTPSVSGAWGNYSWTTGAGSAHNHSVTVNNSTTGGTETRPKNASFMVCIKVI